MRLVPRRLRYGEEATLVEHLEELRQRLFVCLGALAAAFIVTFAFHNRLLHLLNRPLPEHVGKPITLSPAEPLMTALWVSFWAALLITLPIVIWQAWGFFAPAVEERHERPVRWLVLFAAGLLVAGVVFGYYVALPAAVHYLTNFDQELFNIQLRARDYYSFTVMVLVAMGIVFELPIFVLGLVRLGVLTSKKLRKNRRLGYFIVACVAVALPGIDPITTTIEAVPLIALFELSIWLSIFVERRHPTDLREPVSAASE
jgi:sec-independent protein translocase protein TatC